MLTMRGLTTLAFILFLFSYLFSEYAVAQSVTENPNAPFELKNGDRVLFLGNSLFENDLQYGYLELALTTRWPDRNVTYRNIGWSGDNVFGEARSYVTNPPTPYELLIQQITNAKPTVVFLGYGGIEAQEGESGLAHFKRGLNQLLDKIDQLGAKTILISPVPVLLPPSDNVTQRNAMLETYASAIAQTASERKKRYVDVFKPILDVSKRAVITENGIHLNETGYYYLATTLEKALGLAPRNGDITIDVAKNAVESTVPANLLPVDKANTDIHFVINEPYLPLPSPEQDGKSILVDNGRKLMIKGLKKGFYSLTVDDDEVITASANQWGEGVNIRQGPAFTHSAEMRQLIQKKNELFFFQYRPLNQTYIIGFRSYEQGRHKKGLEEQSFIITWLEGQIAALNQPKSATYHLTQLK
ncbi:GDSL-type esterase/lipase family protein [Spirosoma validum]|uniref:GDSL family lipase n=1 Tax=Spirosoma validum TaxID=2771355 RepID=A0A927GC77_9BACT|nr:GDSL-type esterase/lipase family protein [Spirosoma validum]MBD2752171.1 GDSL family lipase [Spirosoma validum]